jgi:HAE1 family hydrophobic/amphiphilic exporter-1
MLCSRYLKPPQEEKKHGWLYRFLGRCLELMNRGYDVTLRWVMKHHVTTMVASGVVLATTIHMFGLVPKGFIPSEDTGQIIINTEGAQGVSYEQMTHLQQQVAAVVAADGNVGSYFSRVGGGGGGETGNSGRIFVVLKPRSERPKVCAGTWFETCQARTADQIISDLRPKLYRIPGLRVSLQNPPVIRIGGRISRSLYQFTLQSPDSTELYKHAYLFEERLRELPELRDLSSDLQLNLSYRSSWTVRKPQPWESPPRASRRANSKKSSGMHTQVGA